VGSRNGVSTEKIEALNDYAKSPLFSDAEKVALEYADAITETHREVDDELFARVQRHYDDDTIAELTMIIAWENASSRFNRAPGVPHPIARVLEAGLPLDRALTAATAAMLGGVEGVAQPEGEAEEGRRVQSCRAARITIEMFTRSPR
jgi:hypothetical protein